MSAYIIMMIPTVIFTTVIGMVAIYYMRKYYIKLSWVIPCLICYFSYKQVLPCFTQFLTLITNVIKQYSIVSGFEKDYAKHMSYLYLEPLKGAISYLVPIIIALAPAIICILYYFKLHKQSDKEKEMKKMKILDL